jgi:hypothetical protein
MIEVFNSLNIFDILYQAAEINKCAYVYFYNRKLETCDDENLVEKVYSYYEEFLPDDLLLIIKANQDNIIKFLTEDSAIMNAASWFPKKDQLLDDSGEFLEDEYYFNCYVIDAGGIIYKN